MDNDEIDLNVVFETLRRQFWLIFLTVLFCVGLAVIYLFSVTPIYTSSALILVDPEQTDLLAPVTAGTMNQSTANARVGSEVEILRSDAVALNVVREQGLLTDEEFGLQVSLREQIERALGIDRDRVTSPQLLVRRTVDRFKSAIEVRRRGLTYLIEVSVSSEVPERSAELTNALAGSYVAQQLENKVQDTLAARDILQAQIEASRADLAQSEVMLDAFIRVNAARIEQETGRTDLSGLVATMEAAKTSRLQTEVLVRQSQENLRDENWADLVAGLENEALTELERQRAGIERRLGQIVTGSQPEVNLLAELAALETRLEKEVAEDIGTLQGQLADLSAREETTRRQLRDRLVADQMPPEILAEVFAIQQDAAIARTQYQNLLARLNDVETRAGVQVADSRIVSPALLPSSPSFPNIRLVLALALVLGAGLGVFLAFLREFVIGGFASSEQLQAATQAPVASTIPLSSNVPSGYGSPADAVMQEPLSPFAESLRRLRASIDQALQKNQGHPGNNHQAACKVIMIASAVPVEGKTTTALALARTYALAGKSVLLIDVDLRKPSIHKASRTTPEKAFIDYLENSDAHPNLKELCRLDPESDVTMLLGKSRSAAPTDRLLSSTAFARIIRAAREKFDVVILDTPPLLPVVDGQYIAPVADAVVMIVRWASTSQSDVRVALPLLRQTKRDEVPILMVLSQRTGGRRGKYQYDYAYGAED